MEASEVSQTGRGRTEHESMHMDTRKQTDVMRSELVQMDMMRIELVQKDAHGHKKC